MAPELLAPLAAQFFMPYSGSLGLSFAQSALATFLAGLAVEPVVLPFDETESVDLLLFFALSVVLVPLVPPLVPEAVAPVEP